MLLRRAMFITGAAVLAASTPLLAVNAFKSPAWLSIESPVNPYDATTRGALLLVHAQLRAGDARAADVSGSAEGLVRGERRTIALRFDETSRPNVFAVRRQWPSDGTWMLRIGLKETTALVTLDPTGAVASVRVPTASAAEGFPLPRPVGRREIDSVLASARR